MAQPSKNNDKDQKKKPNMDPSQNDLVYCIRHDGSPKSKRSIEEALKYLVVQNQVSLIHIQKEVRNRNIDAIVQDDDGAIMATAKPHKIQNTDHFYESCWKVKDKVYLMRMDKK